MPFQRVVGEVEHFQHTDVSKSTIERLTEKAGAAYVAVQTSEVECIERELPTPPLGPAQPFLSVDGAMVPVVGGEWAEVRTLVIGDVLPPTALCATHAAPHSACGACRRDDVAETIPQPGPAMRSGNLLPALAA